MGDSAPSSTSSSKLMNGRSLCFDPSTLSAPSIDVTKFVAEVRSKAPLSVVHDDLQEHLNGIQGDIVSRIQKDFYTYVSLGPALKDVDPLTDALESPLEKLKGDLEVLSKGLDEDIRGLESALAERRSLAERKALLGGLLRANDLLGKCARLLKEGEKEVNGIGLEELERVAGENAQLFFCLKRVGEGKFVAGLLKRAKDSEAGLKSGLSKWFRKALFPSTGVSGNHYDNQTLVRVLAAFAVAGLTEDAEELFRREIVAPFASDRIRMTPMMAAAERELSTKSGASINVNAAHALEAVQREIVAFLGEKVMPITSLCETEERLGGYDFLGKAVWPQIETAIESQMSSSFSPGIPDVFHRSFLAGERIYDAIESCSTSSSHIVSLRQSKTTKDFRRLWNLPVYFQLRFQEITSEFEKTLTEGPSAADENDARNGGERLLRSDVYQAKCTVEMIYALKRCWAEDVLLHPLTHRLLRLSLQLFARYATWVRSGLAGKWTETTILMRGSLVYADITAIKKRVSAELSLLLPLRAKKLNDDILNRIYAAITDSTADLSSIKPHLLTAICSELSKPCRKNLEPLRGILTTYRIPSRPAPSSFSPFVPKVLRPLRIFLQENGESFETDPKVSIIESVADAVSEKYLDMASELLAKNKKSEETLRRLNIGGGSAFKSTAAGAGSITGKILTQLHLDVAKFRDEVETLGGSVDDMPSFSKLWELVQRDKSPAPDRARDDTETQGSDRAHVESTMEPEAENGEDSSHKKAEVEEGLESNESSQR